MTLYARLHDLPRLMSVTLALLAPRDFQLAPIFGRYRRWSLNLLGLDATLIMRSFPALPGMTNVGALIVATRISEQVGTLREWRNLDRALGPTIPRPA